MMAEKVMKLLVRNKNQKQCAKYHCDKHVVKMIVETAQMLSTAHQLNGSPYKDKVYKATHINHPCNIWVRTAKGNYLWTVELFIELLKEYTKRYKKIHKSSRLIRYFVNYCPVKGSKMTDFVLAMPDEYKCSSSVLSYRRYYKGEKRRFAKWNYTEEPEWWNGMS